MKLVQTAVIKNNGMATQKEEERQWHFYFSNERLLMVGL